MVLQNYQNFIEMIFKHDSYCCVGFKWPRKIHLNTQWLPPPDWNKVNLLFIIWWGTGPVPHVPERSGDPAILQRGEQEQQHQRETISVPSNKHVLLSCAWHKTPGRVECSLFSCLNRLGCPDIIFLELFHANETNFIDAILRTTALVQKISRISKWICLVNFGFEIKNWPH